MEPVDPHAHRDEDADDLPLVDLTRSAPDNDAPTDHDRPTRTWWYVIAAAVLVIVGLVVGIIVFNNSGTDASRGTRTARAAAQHYVDAVNSGNRDAAAGIACESFINAAKAEARSGEQGFRYRLDSVRTTADDTATATITATLTVGGAKQSEQLHISVFRSSGLWLMCGQDD